jgi:hypothetical protein
MDREVIIADAIELLGDVEAYLHNKPDHTKEDELLLVRIQRTLDNVANYGQEIYLQGTK